MSAPGWPMSILFCGLEAFGRIQRVDLQLKKAVFLSSRLDVLEVKHFYIGCHLDLSTPMLSAQASFSYFYKQVFLA